MIKPIKPIKRYWLVELRQAKGLKTRNMAEIFGISFQHYNDIETGRRNPSFELCQELAEFFDCPIEKFFENRTKFKKGEN
jgi:DNA-binding XRE family transcriptional regulator